MLHAYIGFPRCPLQTPFPLAYRFHKQGTASIKDKHVSVEDLSAVHLELEVTQVGIVDHLPEGTGQ